MRRFIEVVHEFMIHDAKENEYSERTREKKTYQFNHLTQFLYYTKLQGICADQVKVRHMMEFKEWLRDYTTSKTHGHISRHIRLCSNAMDYAVLMEYCDYNNIPSLKLKRDPDRPVIALDDYEVTLFEGYKTDKPLWRMIVDFYLFMIYTGIGYMDLWLFCVQKERIFYDGHIVNLDLITCISGRGKNGRLYWAEFIAKARGIWEKYGREFPKIHVQTFNRILKDLARELGINKELTTHTGRKTFANIKDDEGYSPAHISKMMGNTEKVLLKHYLKKNKKSLLIEIAKQKTSLRKAA